MDIPSVPSSQITPISGFEIPINIEKAKKETEDFFFSRGQSVYRTYKNAYTSSLGTSPNSKEFLNSFFNILESSFKQQIKDTAELSPEHSISIKELFDIIRSVLVILEKNNISMNALHFYAAVAGFILAKLRK